MTLRNVEIKARITSVPELQEILALQGIEELTEHIVQTDTYFNVSRGRLKLREFPGDTGATSQLIYYCRADEAGAKVSDYQILEVPDADVAKRLFADALGVKAVVHKERYLYMLGRTRIHIDDVKDLGSFLEIEVVLADGEEAEAGEAEAAHIIADLGIGVDAFISGFYCDLVSAL
jgi:predicted adenylyl cyclase CyaB